MRCTVIGAGVIGLSCASRLLDDGHEVTIVTDLEPDETTSAVAAALWYPYLAAPRERVLAWGARTYEVLSMLADTEPAAAIRRRRGREVFRDAQPDPWWSSAVEGLERLRGTDLPAGYADGWSFVAPVVDMPRYLRWLAESATARGARWERRAVTDLGAELDGADVVVCAAGLRAGVIAADDSLTPVRGQVVVVRAPQVDEWWLDDGDGVDLTYVIPRLDTVVVGGTAQAGVSATDTDPATAQAVLARATALVPALAGAEVVAHRVGLRPGRPSVRLDLEDRPAGPVIHCYGHGGAGVTLSWGCADEVAALVRAL